MAYRLRMLSLVFSLPAVSVVAITALGAVVVVGMRAKWSPVIDGVRRMNRSFFASEQRETAGTPGAYAGLLHHRGRTSGTAYETPVSIKRYDDDLVIAIVYGQRTDWLRNVLAAGSAVIVLDGETYHVGQPQIVPMESVANAFSTGDQRLNRVLAIDEALRLRVVQDPPT